MALARRCRHKLLWGKRQARYNESMKFNHRMVLRLSTYNLKINYIYQYRDTPRHSCYASMTETYNIITGLADHDDHDRIIEQQTSIQEIIVHHFYSFSRSLGLGSPIPSSLIANRQSLSGRQGLSYILHILVSPRPFFRLRRVVLA